METPVPQVEEREGGEEQKPKEDGEQESHRTNGAISDEAPQKWKCASVAAESVIGNGALEGLDMNSDVNMRPQGDNGAFKNSVPDSNGVGDDAIGHNEVDADGEGAPEGGGVSCEAASPSDAAGCEIPAQDERPVKIEVEVGVFPDDATTAAAAAAAKKAKKRRPKAKSPSKNKLLDGGSLEDCVKWPQAHILELFRRMDNAIPQDDKLAFKSRVDKLEWERVAFEDYTAEQCKNAWCSIQKKLRRYRMLREILNDAREVLEPQPQKKKGRKNKRDMSPYHLQQQQQQQQYQQITQHLQQYLQQQTSSRLPHQVPELPRKPHTAYKLYFIEKKNKILNDNPGMDLKAISSMISKFYKTIPREERVIYERLAYERKREYEAKMLEYYRANPPQPQPQPQSPVVNNNNNNSAVSATMALPGMTSGVPLLNNFGRNDVAIGGAVGCSGMMSPPLPPPPPPPSITATPPASMQSLLFQQQQMTLVQQNSLPSSLRASPLKQSPGRVPKRPKNIRKMQSPFGLFYQDQFKKTESVEERANLRVQCKEKWRAMTDKEKVVWIDMAIDVENKYQEEMKAYLVEHPDFVPPTLANSKPLLTKEEEKIKERSSGRPIKPLLSAYNIFTSLMLQSEEIKCINPKNRLSVISDQWKALPEEDKKLYRDRADNIMEQYKKDLAAYLEALPEDKRKEELLKMQEGSSKRKSEADARKNKKKKKSSKHRKRPLERPENAEAGEKKDNRKRRWSKERVFRQGVRSSMRHKNVEVKEEPLADEAGDGEKSQELSENCKSIKKEVDVDSCSSSSGSSSGSSDSESSDDESAPKKPHRNEVGDEVTIAKFKGQPKKPPASEYALFCKLYQGAMNKHEAWKRLSKVRKEKYQIQLQILKRDYIAEYAAFLKSLTKEELQEFAKLNLQKKEEEEEEEDEEDEKEIEEKAEGGADGEIIKEEMETEEVKVEEEELEAEKKEEAEKEREEEEEEKEKEKEKDESAVNENGGEDKQND